MSEQLTSLKPYWLTCPSWLRGNYSVGMVPIEREARRRVRTESGGYRRDDLRALAQRVEVDAKEVRIMVKSLLLRTLVAASSAKTAGFGVPSFVPYWRAAPGDDENYFYAITL